MVNNYKNGDVIKASVQMPLVFHYGIVGINPTTGETLIFHNPYGEKPKIDSVTDFFKTRKELEVYSGLTQKTFVELLATFEQLEPKKYRLFKFNCEDFINKMIENEIFESGEIYMIFSAVIFLLMAFLILKLTTNH